MRLQSQVHFQMCILLGQQYWPLQNLPIDDAVDSLSGAWCGSGYLRFLALFFVFLGTAGSLWLGQTWLTDFYALKDGEMAYFIDLYNRTGAAPSAIKDLIDAMKAGWALCASGIIGALTFIALIKQKAPKIFGATLGLIAILPGYYVTDAFLGSGALVLGGLLTLVARPKETSATAVPSPERDTARRLGTGLSYLFGALAIIDFLSMFDAGVDLTGIPLGPVFLGGVAFMFTYANKLETSSADVPARLGLSEELKPLLAEVKPEYFLVLTEDMFIYELYESPDEELKLKDIVDEGTRIECRLNEMEILESQKIKLINKDNASSLRIRVSGVEYALWSQKAKDLRDLVERIRSNESVNPLTWSEIRAMMRKNAGKSRIGGFIGAAIMMIWILVFSLGTDADAETLVREGEFDDCPGATVGTLTDNFFGDPKWESYVGTDERTYVDVTGEGLFNGNPSTMSLQFKVNMDSDSWVVHALEIDGHPQDPDMLYEALCTPENKVERP